MKTTKQKIADLENEIREAKKHNAKVKRALGIVNTLADGRKTLLDNLEDIQMTLQVTEAEINLHLNNSQLMLKPINELNFRLDILKAAV